MTVFFGDVAGSVELYDTLGDERAHEKILSCLGEMTAMIESHGGRVVEVIGDEVMAVFGSADSALEAACGIQRRLMVTNEYQLGVRVGFHSGPTAMTDGHPYGDTVNVAARMVNIAKSGQIMISHLAQESVSEHNQSRVRFVDRVYIKGKKAPYSIHEVIWDNSEHTLVVTPNVEGYANRRRNEVGLILTYRETSVPLTEASGELILGRGKQCGLVVSSDAASRVHATVSCRNGKIIVRDQSTNGTYIRTLQGKRSADGLDLFIHHEEWVSDGVGVMSLGETITEQSPDLVHFRFS